jgi:hypothetical protein
MQPFSPLFDKGDVIYKWLLTPLRTEHQRFLPTLVCILIV